MTSTHPSPESSSDGDVRDPAGPLADVRVCDLTSVVMGPLATRLLADQGADVVRVEGPDGDIIRHYEPMRSPAMGAFSINLNRNKRSVCLDLKSPAGAEALRAIIASSDVFVSTMRRQALERLGLDEAGVRAIRSDIVYCVANGWGSDGPNADQAAYDDAIQAASGLASMFGWHGGDPQLFPSILADKICGVHVAFAITAALHRRALTGRGESVEVPMAETMAAFNLVEHLGGQTFVPTQGAFSYPRVRTANRRPRRTQDGWIVILPYADADWRAFFNRGDEPELADDPRFTTSTDRIEHSDALYGLMDDVVVRHTTADWLDYCRRHSIPAAEVADLEHLADDPHFDAVGLFVDDEHPTEGRYRRVRDPIRIGEPDGSLRHHAPRLGQHTAEVMADLGWSHEMLEQLS